MSARQTLDLTPVEAASLLNRESTGAGTAWRTGSYDAAVDGYVRALGLALQLGPAPAEQALTDIIQTTRDLETSEEASALAMLGPAIVDLVHQVREAGALPATDVMGAWAELTLDVGVLIGQVGLAHALPPMRRREIASNARARATLLDDASNGVLGLVAWLDAKALESDGASR